jgi:hypothetical protein
MSHSIHFQCRPQLHHYPVISSTLSADLPNHQLYSANKLHYTAGYYTMRESNKLCEERRHYKRTMEIIKEKYKS